MKKLLLILFLCIGTLQSHAVLKEKDLPQTLQILRTELTDYYRELSERMEMDKMQRDQVRTKLISIMRRANQSSLMLYSQKHEYVFDLTYACHEATELYHEFHRQQLPFKTFMDKAEGEIARYDSLIVSLKAMPQSMLDDKTKTDRSVCLTLATSIRNSLEENRVTLGEYIQIYNQTDQRLSRLNDYANKRYNDIQHSIFINGGENYPALLQNLGLRWTAMKETVEKKYNLNNSSEEDEKSQWSSKRFKKEEFKKKQPIIIMAATTITFAVIQGFLMNKSSQNFISMASSLLVNYAWLLGVILISLLLRVKGDQIKSAFLIYTPLLAVSFLVIIFRIILIPNEVVNIFLPPILLISALWQWLVIRRHNKNIPRSDMFYSYISLIVFIASVICSWTGYTLMAVQMLIWWMMQLTCVLTITCALQYLKLYGIRHRFAERPITQTWAYDLLYQVLLPVTGVMSVMISIYWAADVFHQSVES